MNESDSERGKRVADEIAALSQADPKTIDTDFGFAVHRAGHAMAPNGEDYLSAGADLAEYLLSDRPLGPGERRELARLVLGEVRRPRGKPEISASNPFVIEVVKALRARCEASGVKKEAVKLEIAHEFRISRATVEAYERIIREREEAHAAAKRKP